MRVISFPQPFAQLIAKGVMRLSMRSWRPGFELPERFAVHASVRAPSKIECIIWFGEQEKALAFAGQGWIERADLTALPRGAIVGTATLAAAHSETEIARGETQVFAWNYETRRMEVGERDSYSGALPDPEANLNRLVAPNFEDEAYAWVFAEALEFEPITGVPGRLRTWKLEGELEGVIAERERRARRRIWRPAPVNAVRRAKGEKKYGKTNLTMRERLIEYAFKQVREKLELRSLVLEKKEEAQMRDHLKRYVTRNRHEHIEGWVNVEPQFRSLVDGRELVPSQEFELAIRRMVKRETDAKEAQARDAYRRKELHRIIDESGIDAIMFADRQALSAKLEKWLEKSLEEEALDLEFRKRRLQPKFETKLEKALMRQLTLRPTDPGYDPELWRPLKEVLIKAGRSEKEVAAALAWEQMKTKMLLEGEG
jgi:hypothetical protein